MRLKLKGDATVRNRTQRGPGRDMLQVIGGKQRSLALAAQI